MEDKITKYTMADIAKEAGVAKSTVSRYFNEGYVRPETREKIRAVVERTGFEPSAAAQNLKAKETHTVGVIVPSMTSPSAGRLITAMDNELRKQGYSCLIITTDHHPEREIAAIDYLRSLRVDGIVLVATTLGEEHQRLQRSSPIPFLVMGQKFTEGTSIVYDDYQAGLTIGQYAAKMGHKDIVYIGVNEDDYAVGVRRRDGVLEGLDDPSKVQKIEMRETTFSYEEAREVARKVLDEGIPDLIIGATDSIALAVYKEVRERGLRVPEDVSIIGFGAYDVSQLLTPALTSIRFENEMAGRLCASTLIAMIKKQPVAPLQVLGFRFMKGQSVADLSQIQSNE